MVRATLVSALAVAFVVAAGVVAAPALAGPACDAATPTQTVSAPQPADTAGTAGDVGSPKES
jgi:hypothetical protein